MSTRIEPELVRFKDLLGMLGLGRTFVIEKVLKDPEFPKPIKLGTTTSWRVSEVRTWIDKKAEGGGL